MARIIYSALIESIKGSIGGTTFQKNKHGYTIKKKPCIVNPNTTRQNSRKVHFSRASRAWRDLSDAQRLAYNTFATDFPQYTKNNPDSKLTGFEVFVKTNSLRLLRGLTILTAAGADIPNSDTCTYALRGDGSHFYIDITSVNEDEEWLILFFLSRPLVSTKNFIGSAVRYVTWGTNTNQSLERSALYSAIFGVIPTVGNRIALDAVFLADNRPYALARDSQIYDVAAVS